MFSILKKQTGLGVLELTILLCSMVAALGGGYLGMGMNNPAVPQQPVAELPGIIMEETKTQEVIIIDWSGQQHGVTLEQGKAYNVMVMPDGKLTIEEKK